MWLLGESAAVLGEELVVFGPSFFCSGFDSVGSAGKAVFCDDGQ